MHRRVQVFLDTNALIHFLENDLFAKYGSQSVEFVTFEKCIYELNNGVKRWFWNKPFLVNCIKTTEDIRGNTTKQTAYNIADKVLTRLALSTEERSILKDEISKYDTKFELGIAMEHVWRSPESMKSSGFSVMKRFYRLVVPLLLDYCWTVRERLEKDNVRVLLYDEVFSHSGTVRLREIMDQSYLPAADLEIAFAAISTMCNVFLTDDADTRRLWPTLGLNHVTRCVDLHQLDTALGEWRD